jgi:enamine deaminase RidA (YjgF/YER057c/UK114 family)
VGRVEQRLQELGLELPEPTALPPGMTIPFAWVRVSGSRVFISGHGATARDGTPVGPFGRVPSEVSLEDAQASARATALSVLGDLSRTIGDLDAITAWVMVQGMVNADPGYPQTTGVINGFSNLILDVFGPEIGAHARTAVGVSALPMNSCVIVAAEVELATEPGV